MRLLESCGSEASLAWMARTPRFVCTHLYCFMYRLRGSLGLPVSLSVDNTGSLRHIADLDSDINCHPISLCELHHVIDSRFASSSFAKHVRSCNECFTSTNVFDRRLTKLERQASEAASTFHARCAFSDGLPLAVRRSPRKSEKKPVYVLDLSIPSQQIDNCLEPAKAAVHLRVCKLNSSYHAVHISDVPT
jgi:hypothetical protein